jgi:hypothetical protein
MYVNLNIYTYAYFIQLKPKKKHYKRKIEVMDQQPPKLRRVKSIKGLEVEYKAIDLFFVPLKKMLSLSKIKIIPMMQ